MRISHIRVSTVAYLTLGFLYACTDNSGLSFHQDGAPPSSGGMTKGAGGGSSATGGTFGGMGGAATATGGSQSGTGGAATGGTNIGMGGTTTPTGGTKSGLGGTTTPTGGTKSGLGGSTSATGGSGSGGTGAGGRSTGTGGAVFDGGVAKDAAIDFVCVPVCDIYCAFGNKLDDKGCPTCSCNPDPQLDAGVDTKGIDGNPITCLAIACPDVYCPNGYLLDANGCPTCTCRPSPVVCPAIKCKACTFGYVKDSNGCDTCSCAADPGTSCASFTSESDCTAAGTRCKWLTPGCTPPSLSASGCYDQTLLNCTTSCPAGLTCLQRSIDPCVNLGCDACSEQIGICL